MDFDFNTVKTELTRLNQESDDLKPEEGLTRLNHISHQILEHLEATKKPKPSERMQMQEALRQVENLNEKFQFNTPVCRVIRRIKEIDHLQL
jgi:hypothetical protein